MATKPATQSHLLAPSVQGLEHGRKQARRRAGRRRVKNAIVSGFIFMIAAGVVGTAGYFLWQFYGEEQDRNQVVQDGVTDPRTADELIDDFEDNPYFQGPGAPAFGVGDEQQP